MGKCQQSRHWISTERGQDGKHQSLPLAFLTSKLTERAYLQYNKKEIMK